MSVSSKRWQTIAPSQFHWEREALEYVREHLPDTEPLRAWSNFEFISDDGSVNEVDLLVVTARGFFLVEIKSRSGTLSGDGLTWVWQHEGRTRTDDNPLILANRKAKKLASLLKQQRAARGIQLPFLEPLIFLSHPETQINLQGVARVRVCVRDRPPTETKQARQGIIAALMNREFEGANEHLRSRVDRPTSKAIGQAMEQAGIRPSQASRRVGDYVLGKMLYESPTGAYQDWEAVHTAIDTARRRIRIYNVARNTTVEERETIRRAARREFQLIETLSHPGILQVESFTEHELGPALIFRHDPEALRLDHFLAQKGAQLNLDTRLNLLRQISEALKYAHEKRVVHRSLSPQSILVSNPDSSAPKIKIFNWQTGYRDAGSTNTTGARSNEPGSSKRLTATMHPERLIEDASTVYVAPEAFSDPESFGEHLDVFSLGAIAYHIFSGQPPATSSLELAERLRVGRGLQISAVMDGAGSELQELIQFSTHPEVSNRLDSASDFLELLGAVEEELTRPDDDAIKNPLEATTGDLLSGGFRVKARLGSGSSAVAFLVERDSKETVLKLASSTDYNTRLRDEYDAIRKLRHPNIVEAYDLVEVGGLTGFTMQRATMPAPTRQHPEADGKTLAGRLRVEGRLHLELLERFGEDLLEAIRHLEEEGIQHRDIKPDNIGIRPLGANTKLRLVLFDFSLSRTPIDNIRAGTTGYIDPFLNRRKPPRWDSSAERFAAAVTLYEMSLLPAP